MIFTIALWVIAGFIFFSDRYYKIIIGNDIEIKSANKTIANQKTNILKKLGLKNTNELRKLLG